MRKLDRNKSAAPAILVAEGGLGQKETNDAIRFFSRRVIPKGEKFTYQAYADPVVKQALATISNNKCAYCEVDVLAAQDGDIEHFRPKGEVRSQTEKPITPGYYWLAAKWENLHLSCIHCNQSRKQPTATGTRTLGKKNQFPLSESAKRVKTHTKNINDEEPYRLLLDPCIDKPEDHLYFDRDGMIFPQQVANGVSPKGEASIEVFALARGNLVRARKNHAIRVETALSFLDDLIIDYNSAVKRKMSKKTIEKRKDKMEKQINKLKVFTDPGTEYSLLSLNIVTNYLAKFNIDYQ